MEAAPSDGKGNPDKTPDPIRKKRLRKRKNSSQSETSSEAKRTKLSRSIRSSSEESTNVPRDPMQNIYGQPRETLSPVTVAARDSTTRSIETIGSAHLSTSESQTSGYTTESTYQTVFGYERLTQSGSSIQRNYGPPPSNILREIHVGINPSSSGEEVQSVRRDLQQLLTNELFHMGRGNNEAIYIIAYNFM